MGNICSSEACVIVTPLEVQNKPVIHCGESGSYGCIINNTDAKYTNLIKQIEISKIVVYSLSSSKTLVNQNQIEEIKSLISTMSFKLYHKNNEETIDSFENELIGNRNALSILGENKTTLNSNFLGLRIYLGEFLALHRQVDGNKEVNNLTQLFILPQTFCTEKDLFDITQSEKRTTIIIQRVYDDITKALQDLHNNNYVHRDIKLDNIVKCGDQYKLIDFGFTKTHENCNEMWKNRYFEGTPGYYHPYLHLNGEIKDTCIQNFQDFFLKTYPQEKYSFVHPSILWFKSDEYALALVLYSISYYTGYKKDPFTDTKYKYNTQILGLCHPKECFLKTTQGGAHIFRLHNKYCVKRRIV